MIPMAGSEPWGSVPGISREPRWEQTPIVCRWATPSHPVVSALYCSSCQWLESSRAGCVLAGHCGEVTRSQRALHAQHRWGIFIMIDAFLSPWVCSTRSVSPIQGTQLASLPFYTACPICGVPPVVATAVGFLSPPLNMSFATRVAVAIHALNSAAASTATARPAAHTGLVQKVSRLR